MTLQNALREHSFYITMSAKIGFKFTLTVLGQKLNFLEDILIKLLQY